MRERMKAFAASFGIVDMGAPARSPNTRRILAAAEWARDQGRLTEFRHAAMNAHWREGLDLEKPEHVRLVAAKAGVDADGALAAMDDKTYLARIDATRAEAGELGITGVPTFVFDLRFAVVGCQPYEVLAQALERAGAAKRLRA